MLINGQWAKDFHPVQGTDEEGGFVRDESRFRNWITLDGGPGAPNPPYQHSVTPGVDYQFPVNGLMPYNP